MEARDYDSWKLDSNESKYCTCDLCGETFDDKEVYDHSHRLYCCGCLEKIKSTCSECGCDLIDREIERDSQLCEQCDGECHCYQCEESK